MVEIGTCEYCNTPNVPVIATSEVGPYCRDCLRLTSDNCKDAIKEIDRQYGKPKGQRKITENRLSALEKQKDDALAKLIGGKIY